MPLRTISTTSSRIEIPYMHLHFEQPPDFWSRGCTYFARATVRLDSNTLVKDSRRAS